MEHKPRCFDSSLTNPHCKNEYQWNPKNEQRLLSMLELSRVGSVKRGHNQESIVNISPQSIDLKLRISEWCVIYGMIFVE